MQSTNDLSDNNSNSHKYRKLSYRKVNANTRNSNNSNSNININSKKTSEGKEKSRHCKDRNVENVVILQGGGSLGAFGCGVLKGLLKKGICLDIVCGTSVGAINGAVFVGSKDKDTDSVESLENFWIEIAESSLNIFPDIFYYDFNTDNNQQYLDRNFFGFPSLLPSLKRVDSAPLNATLFGVPKMFFPRWNSAWFGKKFGDSMEMDINNENRYSDYNTNASAGKPHNYIKNYELLNFLSKFNPSNWTYVYDHSPLKEMLDKYIDYKKISPGSMQSNIQHQNNKDSDKIMNKRLIVTAVDVMTSESLSFDSFNMDIKSKHLLACCGYPVYGFPWVEIEKGVYGWDGSLLNNTPLREVLQASPRNDKNIFIVENYPRKIDKLPGNMVEVLDRTRDIIFSDKTKFTIRLSKVITRQIQLIEDLYEIFENTDKSKITKEKTERITKEYQSLVSNHGAEILSINRIIRDRIETPNISKNADFSPSTIRNLIDEGERKASDCIDNDVEISQ
ncbi:hypothetical protein BH23THE1_BH23THE1_21930 [soil metagenome]